MLEELVLNMNMLKWKQEHDYTYDVYTNIM